MLLVGMLPLLAYLSAASLFGPGLHVNERVHEILELTGCCIALAVAMLLWLRFQHGEESPHLLWITASLSSMGLLDGTHAVVPFGLSWAWLRHGAMFIGGLLLALVWLPVPVWVLHRRRSLLSLLALLTLALALGMCWRPDLLPVPWGRSGGIVTRVAEWLGGVGFAAEALFFLRLYLRNERSESLVFVCQSMFFASAGYIVTLSRPWDAVWWWHGVRLLGYGQHLVAAYQMLAALFQKTVSYAQELEGRVEERTTELREAYHQTELLLAAVPSLLIGLDASGRITRWNSRAAAVFGLTEVTIVGADHGRTDDNWRYLRHPRTSASLSP